MTTFLRKIYEVLSCFSTETQMAMCDDMLRQLMERVPSAALHNGSRLHNG